MKTAREIIEETAAFYTSENRAKPDNGRRCQYLTKDGRMCAVGRCLTDPARIEGNYIFLQSIPNLDDELKPEYRGHPINFWQDLQRLHDYTFNWNNEGLSNDGESVRNRLLEKWVVDAS